MTGVQTCALPIFNNPIEAASHWKAGTLRALCVFDQEPMPYPGKITSSQSWKDVPTCRSQGLDVEYLMLRGIFMPPKSTPAQVAFYQDLFSKVRALPEWKEFLEAGAFKDLSLSGAEYVDWLNKAEAEHTRLMTEAGLDRKSTRLNSSHMSESRMPSSA